MNALANIYWLGTKELRSFFRDYVLLGLVIYTFSFAVIAQGQSMSQEVHNASVGVVDDDNSVLSRRMIAAILPPYFKRPQPVTERDIDHLMDTARYTFVIVDSAAFRTRRRRRPGARGAGQYRCHGHGPGRARFRLYAADSHDGSREFRFAQ